MEYGSWTDHGATGISSTSAKPYNAIDPNLIAVGSSYYMNFGSFWGDLYQAPMASNAHTAASSSYQIAYQPSGSHAQEGSFMYYRSGYYYLFWSEGICCGYDTSKPASGAEYKIRVCRSTSATGGFVDASGTSCTSGGGTTVLASHDRCLTRTPFVGPGITASCCHSSSRGGCGSGDRFSPGYRKLASLITSLWQ